MRIVLAVGGGGDRKVGGLKESRRMRSDPIKREGKRRTTVNDVVHIKWKSTNPGQASNTALKDAMPSPSPPQLLMSRTCIQISKLVNPVSFLKIGTTVVSLLSYTGSHVKSSVSIVSG